MQSAKQWLLYHSEPQDIVYQKWKASYALRRTEILDGNRGEDKLTQILKEWPLFNKAEAKIYVSLSF